MQTTHETLTTAQNERLHTRCIHMRQGSPSSHSTSALSRTQASDASTGPTKIPSKQHWQAAGQTMSVPSWQR